MDKKRGNKKTGRKRTGLCHGRGGGQRPRTASKLSQTGRKLDKRPGVGPPSGKEVPGTKCAKKKTDLGFSRPLCGVDEAAPETGGKLLCLQARKKSAFKKEVLNTKKNKGIQKEERRSRDKGKVIC